jgi:hypothetical protein
VDFLMQDQNGKERGLVFFLYREGRLICEFLQKFLVKTWMAGSLKP